jgi:vacuolar protein sorting-associated protein 13A/C
VRGDARHLTLWRPIPPAGYVALGLLATAGQHAPSLSQVGMQGAGAGLAPRTLSAPQGQARRALGNEGPGSRGLAGTLHDVCPTGAHLSATPPFLSRAGRKLPPHGPPRPPPRPPTKVRCVRADAATPVDLQPNAPNWILMPHKQRAAVAGWLVEERCCTFTVVVHDGTPQRLEGFRLAAVDGGGAGGADGETAVAGDFEGGADAAAGAGGGAPAGPPKPLHVSIKVGQVNLLLRSLLRTPILELEMREVKVGARPGRATL